MTSICAPQCQPKIGALRALILVSVIWFAPGESVRADVTGDTLADIAKCSTIEDSMARLRCFDRVAPRARAALAPQAEDFGKPPAVARPEVEQLTASVRELSRTLRGRAIFALDNGQVWRQIDGDDTQIPDPNAGDPPLKVTIAKGLFGSYNLTIEGRNGLVKVRRIE